MIFLHKPDQEVKAYVIPISGNGLWGLMKGYLALEPDLTTIKGVRFVEHVETPGLGAEAEKPWFTNNYIGKKILDEGGKLRPIKVAKGKAGADDEVDGISGATLTGKGITQFMEKDLQAYEPFFQILRRLHAEGKTTEQPPAAEGAQ
jgi:Na+-transporting NADH:ubiquinone oxidoreductase subunit C